MHEQDPSTFIWGGCKDHVINFRINFGNVSGYSRDSSCFQWFQ